MSDKIFLKKTIKLSDIEKTEALEECKQTKNINIYENFTDLYYSYFEKIENKDFVMQCFHEFSINNNSMICMFFDIDINKKTLPDLEQIINIYNNNSKSSDTSDSSSYDKYEISDLYLLKRLIEKFCKYLYKNNKNTYDINYIYDDDYIDINEISLKKFLSLCYKNLVISKNVIDEKYSYHVYFNNILFNIQEINIIKNLVKKFISIENNPFVSGIDTQVYKKKISLRTIYSKKNNDDDTKYNFHYPLSVYHKKHILYIDQIRDIITKDNLQNYFCTINNIQNKKYLFLHKSENIESSSEDEIKEIIAEDQNILKFTNTPNLRFLTLKNILSMVFNQKTLVLFQANIFLENIDLLNSNTLYIDYIYKHKELTLDFNYNVSYCIFCNKKKVHKNKHYISAGIFGINVIKKGNSKSCIIKSIPYKTMTDIKICEYIYKLGIIKKTLEGEIIYFTNLDGWKYLENNMFSGIKNLMKTCYENFRNIEIEVIDNMSDKKIKECFYTLTFDDIKVNTIYPYMFKFKNGILDLKTNEFINMKDSKSIYIVNTVGYDYIPMCDYTEEQKQNHIFIEEIINQIIPHEIENKTNYYRHIFECNISSCLAKDHKDIITVFIGATKAGKTTIKYLIRTTLGDKENFIDIPISVYTQPINPKVPDPWLGQIENKSVSFASEPGFERTVNTQTIKLLTEARILSRKLYSNDVGQLNFLSQFIDTNHELKFDNEDPAAYRRWAVIKFQSHFQTHDESNLLLNSNIDASNKYLQLNNLKSDILKNKYALNFFHILYKWFKIYHNNGLKMENTAAISPFYLVNECINNMTIPGCIIESAYIKNEKKTNYIKAKYRINYNKTKITLGTNKKYFITYFEKFLTYKKITYNLNKLLSELVIILKTTSIVPFVLIEDLKEEHFDIILEKYKKIINNDNNTIKSFDLTYYNNNKFIFNQELEDEDCVFNDFNENN